MPKILLLKNFLKTNLIKVKNFNHQIRTGLISNIRVILTKSKYIRQLKVKKEYEKEFTEEYLATKLMIKNKKLPYPDNWAVSKKSALLLYSLVREKKPEVVLETGVANGFSTRFILAAIKKNEKGKLFSVDIKSDVGTLVPDSYKDSWSLVIGEQPVTFSNVTKKLDKIDIFFHDSDHSYSNMQFEFEAVKEKVQYAIVSDDIQYNNAFFEFAKELKIRPIIYLTTMKAIGLLIL
jgi:predicted O-methyltransferase YrrM